MGVYIASFKITGLSPLLMNNPASMQRAPAGIAKKVIPTPEVEAEAKVYRLPNKQLFIKTMAFRSALLGACAGRRLGKVGAKSIVSGAVFSTAAEAPLVHPMTGKPIETYQINIARAVVQKNGVLRARPEVPEWACQLDFEIDDDFIADDQIVLDLLNIAGKIRGVLDWRPEKMGPYGRFRAERVSNVVKAKKAG